MKKYTVKGLSKISGVSVCTLHHYDDIGLLRPALRTDTRYRLYGENELLRLQQILFYKELDFSLKEITDLLNDPDFDILQSLEHHKEALICKQQRISLMLNTIDKTMNQLKAKKMITNDELYEGFSKESIKKIRSEAIERYGIGNIERSESFLKKLSKEQLEHLKEELKSIFQRLYEFSDRKPESEVVQLEIARHYHTIRKFWGTDGAADSQKRAYKGLGELYLTDERFTRIEGKPQPAFAAFLCQAMTSFATTQLS